MPKGFLVAFEAPSGAGKGTHSKAVANILAQERPTLWTSVTNMPLGQFIKQSDKNTKGLAFAYLVAAGTQQLFDEMIKPALDAGKIVIVNRYIGSSLALLQADRVRMNLVWRINKLFMPPDLVVSLFAPHKILEQRLRERKKMTRFTECMTCRGEAIAFRQAMNFLRSKNINVLDFNTDRSDVGALSHEIAMKILQNIK